MKLLLDKITNKEAVVGIIGLGYVGLPLAVESAKSGFKTIGFDIQQSKITMLNNGENYIGDIVSEDLGKLVKEKKLSGTTDYSLIKNCDVIIICVPTPLDKYMQPDNQYIVNSTNEIAKYKKNSTLVVLESTTYPGATEEIVKPILEKDGSIIGKDFFLAFSPERIDPGNTTFKTKNTPKVVGGVTESCNLLTSTFYNAILTGGVHTVSSPKVAEMEKLLENIFRLVNIGLVNELALLCDRMNINIWEVIEAAKTKPYGFMPFYPGPGLGGHCIPIDPYYLTWKAKEFHFNTALIETAGNINHKMPEYVADKVGNILNSINKCYSNSNIVILGVAYKKDIDDYRESPVLRIIDILKNFGSTVNVVDPYVVEFKGNDGNKYKTTHLTEKLLQNADLVIITTDHSKFDKEFIFENSKLIYDTRNFIKIESKKVIRL
ncbi:MAG TPA: nucleotide sugar dehydrogenase [Spirochaetota bacterium]|nr:nucleotide sugar dehydrogenase [Spirochaetota bacterium]